MTPIFIEMFKAGFGRWHWVSLLSDRTVLMRSTKPVFGFARAREQAHDVSVAYLEANR